MNTKDTTEVAGEFSEQVPSLGTVLYVLLPFFALASLVLVAIFPSALGYIWPLSSRLPLTEPSLLVPPREQPPPEDLPPQETAGVSSSMCPAASRAAPVEYK